MECTELMLDDWVLDTYTGKPMRVQVVKIKVGKGLDPIPITPEILEKNGFEDMGFYSEFKDGDWRVMCDAKNVAILHREHCNIDTPVEYVHDLQHALKLCRIDKEIVV